MSEPEGLEYLENYAHEDVSETTYGSHLLPEKQHEISKSNESYPYVVKCLVVLGYKNTNVLQ